MIHKRVLKTDLKIRFNIGFQLKVQNLNPVIVVNPQVISPASSLLNLGLRLHG